jgi:primosomal protein N' (replication factor Y)
VRVVKLSRTRNPSDLITNELKVLTKRAIDQGNQAIFLLNRRGFALAVLCDECGAPLTCPFCSIGLTLHRSDNMVCHYCGFTARKPDSCPACGHGELVTIGSGTQRIEETVAETFRTARVFRLDQDTARRKDTASGLVEKMRNGEIDILLGTQMVSKGFDFHGVTLVGVMLADIGLTLPDFRASERIFALLTQVAGRCGRGSARGTVIVQTLNEENRLFDFLKKHDYEGYAEYELSMRRALSYPPYARLARLLVRGVREEKVTAAIDLLAKKITELVAARSGDIRLLGPSPAPLAKIASNYRYHLILKSNNAEAMREVIRSARECILSRDVYLEIDIDPFDML